MAKEYRQNASHDLIRKDYTKPTIEVIEGDFDGGRGNRYSLPYGLCKGAGIDTDGMTPREAWEAYTNKTGFSKKQAEEAHWGDSEEKDEPREQTKVDRVNEQPFLEMRLSPQQEESLKRLENVIKGRKTEKAYYVDEEGVIVAESKKGTRNRTTVSISVFADLSSVVSTHNHPSTSGREDCAPFSTTDLMTLNRVRGIRVVNQYGGYELIKTSSFQFSSFEKAVILDLRKIENDYTNTANQLNAKLRAAWLMRDGGEKERVIMEEWKKNEDNYYKKANALLKKSENLGYTFKFIGR